MSTASGVVRVQNDNARYFGEIQDAFPHGYGIMHTDSFTYDGNFQHGRFHGIGALNVRNKYYYRGNFVSGYFQNHGYLIRYDDDWEYEGQFMTGCMTGFGRLRTAQFTFEGYISNNKLQMGLYQEFQRKLKYLGTFELDKPKSGTLWAMIGAQQVKIQTTFDQDMRPGQQGLITTRRAQIFYDGWQCSQRLDVHGFLSALLSSETHTYVVINCKKTYAKQSSYYVGRTLNLVPDGEGILYISSQNCLQGQFQNGKFAGGRMEIRMGMQIFSSGNGHGSSVGKNYYRNNNSGENIQNGAQLGGTVISWPEKAEQSKFQYIMGCAAENRVLLGYRDAAQRLDFLGYVRQNKADGRCLVHLGSNLLEAEFLQGRINGPAILQQGSIFQLGQYTSGRKTGQFSAILGKFVYQMQYDAGTLHNYALFDTERGTLVVFDRYRSSGLVSVNGAPRAAFELDRGAGGRYIMHISVRPGITFRRYFCGLRYDAILEVLTSMRLERVALRRGFWLLQREALELCEIP